MHISFVIYHVSLAVNISMAKFLLISADYNNKCARKREARRLPVAGIPELLKLNTRIPHQTNHNRSQRYPH